ncbi:MAG TPA: AGE family epimerase/isomerase [Parvibaculum sp.]
MERLSIPRLTEIDRWTFDDALPLWAGAGQDRPGHGFMERLTFEGTPIDVPFKRLRVQARQIYVFSHATLLGWRGPALEAARNGFDFVLHHGWLPEGGWALKLGPEGGIVDPTLALYEQAFMLFALGWYARATNDELAIDWAHRTLDATHARLGLLDMPGFRSEPPKADMLEQNAHMHLLEAMLVLYETTRHQRFLDEAQSIVALLEKHLFQTDRGIIPEFFDAAWRPLPDTHVEPGHHFEWVWLLAEYRRIVGTDMSHIARRLFEFADSNGVSSTTGLIYDAVNADGSPRSRDHRSWCQAEALKAHLIIQDLGGTVDAQKIETITGNILDRFLSTSRRGLWADHLAADLTIKSDHVPATSLYHFFLAFSELRRLASKSS